MKILLPFKMEEGQRRFDFSVHLPNTDDPDEARRWFQDWIERGRQLWATHRQWWTREDEDEHLDVLAEAVLQESTAPPPPPPPSTPKGDFMRFKFVLSGEKAELPSKKRPFQPDSIEEEEEEEEEEDEEEEEYVYEDPNARPPKQPKKRINDPDEIAFGTLIRSKTLLANYLVIKTDLLTDSVFAVETRGNWFIRRLETSDYEIVRHNPTHRLPKPGDFVIYQATVFRIKAFSVILPNTRLAYLLEDKNAQTWHQKMTDLTLLGSPYCVTAKRLTKFSIPIILSYLDLRHAGWKEFWNSMLTHGKAEKLNYSDVDVLAIKAAIRHEAAQPKFRPGPLARFVKRRSGKSSDIYRFMVIDYACAIYKNYFEGGGGGAGKSFSDFWVRDCSEWAADFNIATIQQFIRRYKTLIEYPFFYFMHFAAITQKTIPLLNIFFMTPLCMNERSLCF